VTSCQPPGDAAPGPGTVASERRQLTSVAYRLLGSMTEAEDVVQETFARWYALSPAQQQSVASPGAWLTTVTSRICLDLLGSARVRRETYLGAWIPEPVPGRLTLGDERSERRAADPADRVTLDESINMAFLVILDSMTPAERVAFVLHDVFRYPFTDVATIVGRTPAACRQLASSARRRIATARTRGAPAAQQTAVVGRFRTAWEAKDIGALISILDPQATTTADGGGLVNAQLHPIEGAEQVAQALVRVIDQETDLTFAECSVNGQPGLVVHNGGAAIVVMAFAITQDRIKHIWAVRNPDKLRLWDAS
jgi:RNA polymerase sigma factor (sigma-70 family)